MSTFTRECSFVYFERPGYEEVLSFTKKKVKAYNEFNQRVFCSQDRFQHQEVKDALLQVQKQLLEEQQSNSGLCGLTKSTVKPTWKDTINQKRQIVKRVIQNQSTLNLAEVARVTKTSRDLVKRVHRELSGPGEVSEYGYNNLHSREEEEELEKTVDQIEEGYMTVAEIKRKHSAFSKKKILDVLHSRGYRYRLMPKERRNPKLHTPNSTRICRIISHITQAILDPNTTILYCDEMKFPLYQTSEKRWTHKDIKADEDLIYNRRYPDKTQLTAIALCSLEKFEAVQIFKHEVSAADFLYFLNKAISHLPPTKHYTIIADNATWHHAGIVSSTKAHQFLYFNEPKMFQLNIIENAFSFIRHAFRIRDNLFSLEEEAKTIVRIFFDSQNVDRFKGLFRNHFRLLIEFLERHKGS